MQKELITPIECPCCRQPVKSPPPEVLVVKCKIPPMEARILKAVWRGKGMAVPTSKIFDAMYADDPDGGPSNGKMYKAFKLSLHKLRKRLDGSGVMVETVGYRRGYRLVFEN